MSKIKEEFHDLISNYQFDIIDDFDYYLYMRDMNEYQEQLEKLEEQKKLELDAMWEDYSYSII
jgi:L-rhamnose isomerase